MSLEMFMRAVVMFTFEFVSDVFTILLVPHVELFF
jgi:hypothetical protein